MNYAIEQRLRLIDFLVAQYGHVNRATLMEYFGTGPACATRDFRLYIKMAPDNLVLNGSDKTYYRTNAFKKIWN